uniref:FCH and mu domain containing endocytic adaptor 1 n=1 Tax=Ovis aries TaxID=9940 RepID=A0AC11D4X4_SHEEP
MSYFGEYFWGEKNHGFEVLYHSVKQGPISTKELADFIRERATIEETYSKAMAKLSKLASNGTPMGTFAPLWEVFRVSSDKLALCHLELTRKLQDLIKDVLRHGEEQLKAHKKCKEEAVGTLDAIQVLTGVSQLLPKSRENYLNRCMDQERLRRESTSQKEMDKAETKTRKAAESLRRLVEKYNSARSDFEQKMLDSALRFQAMEETHLQQMKALMGSYAHSVEDTHVQIGQVHEEFKQNVENVSVEMLLRKFAESKGTGQEKPGPLDFEAYRAATLQEAMKRLRGAKAFRLPGLSRREREPPTAVDSLEPDLGTCPEVDEEGFTVRPDVTQNSTAESTHFSSSDSDFDDEEPRKIYVHIKPASARAPPCSPKAAAAQLKATAGSLILPPGPGGTMKRHSSRDTVGRPQRPQSAPRASSCAEKLQSDEQVSKNLFGPTLESALDHEDFTDLMPVPADFAVREGLAAPSRRPRSRKASCPLMRSNGDLSRSLSPSPLGSSAPSSIPERPSFTSQTGHGVSRGPSPVVLGSQDALPVATAFTEYVHAYFRGHSPSCLARVTGELTMTFPAGIVRVFSGTPPPPVLSFRLVHTAPIEHFQPNADLLFSDPSQSDPETKDFWLNMTTLTETLQRQAEQNPAASYYNVVLLRYQFSRPGPQSMPLQLSAHWQCGPTLTQVSVEYSYQPGATVVPTPLTNVQILLPVGEPVTNVRLQPAATWNLEEKRLLWKLPDVSEAGGSGRLSASWEPCSGPSTPSPVAAQFTSEGATLSGVDVELVGSGYRMSLVKRRFATGKYLVSC